MRKQNNRRTKALAPQNENPANAPQFLSPFLLGVAVALLLVMIPTIAGFMWMCGDVNFQVEGPFCPSLVVKKSQAEKKGRNFLEIFGLRKQEDEKEYHILVGDPIERSCRSIADAWTVFKSKKGRDSSKNFCSPKILNEAAMDDTDEPNSVPSASHGQDEFKTAFTNSFLQLTPREKQLILTLQERVVSGVSEWSKRASMVPWGGHDTLPWFSPGNTDGKSELEQLDGGSLLYSYLRIMKWPTDLISNFPFKLCVKGCASELGKDASCCVPLLNSDRRYLTSCRRLPAISHTLTFRELYMPWAVSPSTIKENSDGAIFHHGVSPGFDEKSEGHSLVS